MLQCIKRDTCAGLGANQVENLMRILQEGSLLECFDPTDAMKLLADYVVQRLAQSQIIIIIVSPRAQMMMMMMMMMIMMMMMMMMMSLKCEEHADHTLSKKSLFLSLVRFIF